MTKYSKEIILKEIILLKTKLKRTPNSKDNMALASAAQRYFGSWINALIELDLFPCKKRLKELYINDYLSCQKIADKYNLTRSAIIQMLKRHKIKSRSTKDYVGLLPSGKNHPNWKGGKFQCSKTGYVIHIKNGKHFPEHRLIMEKHLKRPLKKDEVVHHINGVTDDNRIENLMIMDSSNHSQLHWKYVKELKKRIRFLEKEVKRLSPS